MITVEEYAVPASFSESRLMDYACYQFDTLPSRTAAKKAIKRGEVLLDGAEADPFTILNAGQMVSLVDLELNPPKSYELELDVLFEDEHLAIIRKPAGLPVSGNRFKTIGNALSFNLKPSVEADALGWPKPVHRLDVPTTGLLIAAKTARSLMQLGKLFQDRQIRKRYRAVVIGKTDDSGTINDPVNEQNAVTQYNKIRSIPSLKTGFLSLVDLFPLTGRKHQLRVHMTNAGHPVVGDNVYNTAYPLLKGKGLFLSAVELEFNHPVFEKKVHIQVEQPEKFDALLEREEKRWKKYKG